jgi:subtilisin family serine protease
VIEVAPTGALEVPREEPSGAGTTIAIVDSGVDPSHPWLAEATLRHVRVATDGPKPTVVPCEGGDGSGHGTACAGLIHRLAPRATLVDVRVLDENGRSSREALVAALRYCVRERFTVVSLSLGIDVPRAAQLAPLDAKAVLDLYEAADAAYTARVVLVAAGPNVATFRTYPGRVKALVGVGRGAFSEPLALRTELTLDYELLAPGTDVLAPALGGGERRYTGTSFAVPHVSARVARLAAWDPSLGVDAMKSALHRLAAAYALSSRPS